jgi:basic membrane protein A
MIKRLLQGCAVALALVTMAAAADAAALRVAMITSESGLGDKGGNDMMKEGLERAKKDFGIDYVIIQPRTISDFQATIQRAAGLHFDLIIGSSFDMIKPMAAVAGSFPNQKFALLDIGPDPIAPNIASTVTKDWEGSFLVGAIAGLVTKSGTIGFVGGKDIPIIHRFFVGYFYGAKTVNPNTNLIESYSGSFTDPAIGKEFTLAAVSSKADIVYAAAGAAGAGVIEGAKQTKTFAIGVDSNQNYMAPGFVLTSMVKRVDNEAYDQVKALSNGSFKGGAVTLYGLKEGGVDYAMDQYNKGLIPDDVVAKVEDLRKKVSDGTIVVPNYFDLKKGDKQMGTPPLPVPPSFASQ